MAYTPYSYAYQPMALNEFTGGTGGNVPIFERTIGMSLPDLLQQLTSYKLSLAQPALEERKREFDQNYALQKALEDLQIKKGEQELYFQQFINPSQMGPTAASVDPNRLTPAATNYLLGQYSKVGGNVMEPGIADYFSQVFDQPSNLGGVNLSAARR